MDLAPNDYVSDFLEKLNLNPGKSMIDKSKLDFDGEDFQIKSASPQTKAKAADVSHMNPLSDTD